MDPNNQDMVVELYKRLEELKKSNVIVNVYGSFRMGPYYKEVGGPHCFAQM